MIDRVQYRTITGLFHPPEWNRQIANQSDSITGSKLQTWIKLKILLVILLSFLHGQPTNIAELVVQKAGYSHGTAPIKIQYTIAVAGTLEYKLHLIKPKLKFTSPVGRQKILGKFICSANSWETSNLGLQDCSAIE